MNLIIEDKNTLKFIATIKEVITKDEKEEKIIKKNSKRILWWKDYVFSSLESFYGCHFQSCQKVLLISPRLYVFIS